MSTQDKRIQPVILSGGAGTRLWPLSRRNRPKQFLEILTDQPLIVDTARRVADPTRFLPPIFVANDEHRFMIAEAMRRAGLAVGDIVLEPDARNTAAPIAAAAVIAAARDPGAMLLVLPSDHAIGDERGFLKAVATGAEAALAGYLTVFGMSADKPDTGYGYIRAAAPLAETPGVLGVAAFREKPDAAAAAAMLAEGGWSWNSGMFLFRAEAVIDAFLAHAPEILAAARKSVDAAARDLDFMRLDASAWREAETIPFDTAIMEKTDRAAVVPTDIGWSDIGTWTSLAETATPDPAGNVVMGNVAVHEVADSLLRSEGPMIAAAGIEGLTVVATKDAVLVVPKDRSQDVRHLVATMERDGHPELAGSTVGYRPWGHYEEIDVGPGFKVKRIVVNPGQTLSRQMHHRRAEHWVVVSGTAHVLRGDEEFAVEANQSVYIPVETQHRLVNKGEVPLQVIEVQTGDYLEEDDIVRFDDVYGRE